MRHRHAGLLLPLFSAASSTSWGVGELPDVVPLGNWMAAAGFDRLMLLPIGTIPDGETSPYSAASAMAIDPLYVAVHEVEDFRRAGGVAALSPDVRRRLESAMASASVRHDDVRAVKAAALDLAFGQFVDYEWRRQSDRAANFAAYAARESWWLDDYALFRALAAERPGQSWQQWPAPLRHRHPDALAEARRALERPVRREQYIQWLAEGSWQDARRALHARGITTVGDLPFVAALASADVWSRAGEYLLDVTVGAPPDAFSAAGQDWGLPGYRWEAVAARGYDVVRMRARRMAALFDGIRIDHLVGLYRTFVRPPEGPPFFLPDREDSQLRQGEAVLSVFQATGALVLAEDLGTVPDFVRASMARLGVPGTKVLRWERHWNQPGHPFVDPGQYPPASVAMTGTHDTEPLVEWWTRAGVDERRAVVELPAMAFQGFHDPHEPWSDRLRDALLALAWHSASNELFAPVQDLFGWPVRINTPGVVTSANWSWRLPWPVNALGREREPVDRARALQALAVAAGRGRNSDGW